MQPSFAKSAPHRIHLQDDEGSKFPAIELGKSPSHLQTGQSMPLTWQIHMRYVILARRESMTPEVSEYLGKGSIKIEICWWHW